MQVRFLKKLEVWRSLSEDDDVGVLFSVHVEAEVFSKRVLLLFGERSK